MKDTTNYSINKCLKSITTNKSLPKYELQKNSFLEVSLPNGMQLTIITNKAGESCFIEVVNMVKNNTNFKTIKKQDTSNHHDFTVNSSKLTAINYDKYSRLAFEYKEFNNK